ncbi:MAG: hypothetical protein DDT42_00445 [candidate division WS2 bacterium]|uniref:Uncharacterized protein n=1 Tax=Psychracetigena formicireducens TaxID=2986056 RepID=A0A9E2BFE1_PSYF1|nr:hypothetical protein [Candidatus Psychracetigena formicireducens]
MPYATVADIRELLKTITITATTRMTEAELIRHISDVEAVLDARLFDFYAVPITGIRALRIMNTISKYKTAATVLDILMGATGQETVEPTIKRWHKLADDLVEELKNRATDLSDAGGREATGLAITGRREPTFRIDEKF